MAAADDIRNFQTGETGNPNDPFNQGWMSHIRARKALGDNVKKAPFTRAWGTIKTVASCMQQDKLTAIADAVGWRDVNVEPDLIALGLPKVVDVGDVIKIAWHYFKLAANRDIMKQAIINAKVFNKWPDDYSATEAVASFEKGT